MRTIIAIIILLITANGCVRTEPEPEAEPEPDRRANAAPTQRVAEAQEPGPQPTPQPTAIVRWDTAYDRPHALESIIGETVEAWQRLGGRLPAQCFADLLETRIELWPADAMDTACWDGVDACTLRMRTSGRILVRIPDNVPMRLMVHEIWHVMHWCAGVDEGGHSTGMWPRFDDAMGHVEPRSTFHASALQPAQTAD